MFQFIGVTDCGSTSCPCCGAEGRYIYKWVDDSGSHAAMMGCYQRLTGMIQKDDASKAIERAFEKQARGKTLNGWDKTIIRMSDYIKANDGYSIKTAWATSKINEAIRECKKYRSRF